MWCTVCGSEPVAAHSLTARPMYLSREVTTAVAVHEHAFQFDIEQGYGAMSGLS